MSDGRYGFIPNLHILLEGDRLVAEMYLSFGMEQVRKLIRTCPYDAQRNLVLPDNTHIRIKKVADQRFLHIIAEPPCELYLESGIVHVGSLGPANPAFNDDGKLYLNPALEAMPELNGLLTLPLATEEEPEPVSGDTAQSFKKKSKTDANGNVTVDQASLSELQRKKLTVAMVPPSLFTGKTRLYVQAIYGRRLKHFKGWGINSNYQPPALRYTGRHEGEDYTADISTSTGIFTTEDYNYFLLQVMGGSAQYVTVRKLVAESACVEAARAYLVKNKDRLTEAKKTALEAYILSGSYPSEAIKFNIDAVIATNWEMGYGWHFNWSGTACDIVRVETIDLGGSLYKHRSTHYRMGFSRDKDKTIPVSEPPLTPAQQERLRWAAIQQTTVETKEWKNAKWFEVIVHPDWAENKLQVFGQIWGDSFGDGAPLYCFYRGDDLQVLRYTESGGDAGYTWERTSEPVYYAGEASGTGPTPGGECEYTSITVGLEGGRKDVRLWSVAPRAVSFAIGEASVSATQQSYTYSFHETSGKNIAGTGYLYTNSFFIPGNETWQIPTGMPVQPYGGPNSCALGPAGDWETTPVTGYQSYGYRQMFIEYDVTVGTGNKSEGTQLLAVIPFYDAEAVYLYGQKSTVTTETGTVSHIYAGQIMGGFVERTEFQPSGQIVDKYHSDAGWGGSMPVVGTDAHSLYTEISEALGAYLACSAGVLEASGLPVTSAFFAGEPTTHVEQTYSTWSSAALKSVKGQGVPLTGGYAAALDAAPKVFVGHA